MRKLLRILLAGVVIAIVAVAVLLTGAYRAVKHEPKFYQQALKLEPQLQARAGDQLERQVLQLHNDVRQHGRWEAVFTSEEINGWLAVDLPEKFPATLPPGVSDPRVAIDPERAQVACRYEDDRMTTVVSLALELHLTDEPNVLAVRICQARAGLLPLPLKPWLDRISLAAERGGLPLRWLTKDGDPVALVTIPVEHEEYRQRNVHLETLLLRDGEIYLAGYTETAEPTGDVGGLSSEQSEAVVYPLSAKPTTQR